MVNGTAPIIGSMIQFTAIAVLSNGAVQTVTTQATWQSSVPRVATVDDTGIVTGIAVGSTDITATYRNVSGVIHIAIAALTPLPAPPPPPVPVPSRIVAAIGSRRFSTDSATVEVDPSSPQLALSRSVCHAPCALLFASIS